MQLPERWLSFLVGCLGVLLLPFVAQGDGVDDEDDFFSRLLAKQEVAEGRNPEDAAPLWNHVDGKLQKDLQGAIRSLGLDGAVRSHKLSVALVDISNPKRPRVASVNGDEMMYAASLPKIAVLLAAFQRVADGKLKLDAETEEQMLRMIRHSSNRDTTALMHRVGKEYIASVLVSPRYRLYNPMHNGGLWVGKDYGKSGLWHRDPIHNLSHGATALQVARFYYMLDQGKLVNQWSSRRMKEILANTAIDHKFKKGLHMVRPDAEIFRKSGTWDRYHADSAIIEYGNVRYIAVALAESNKGGEWLKRLIMAMDRLVEKKA